MDDNKDIEKLTDTDIEKTDIESINPEPLPVHPQKKERKPKNKKKLIIIGLIVLVLLIAGGIGAYFLINKDSNKESKTSDKSKVVEKEKVSSFTPQNAIDAVKDALEQNYQLQAEGSELSGEQISYKTSDRAPYWKVPGEKFYVNYKGMGASSLEVYTSYDSTDMNKARGTAAVTAIQGSLADKGFVKSTDNAYGQQYSVQTAFIKDDVICLTSSLDDNSIYNIPYTVSCGNISKYNSELTTYKESKPFADAYLDADKTIQEGSTFSFSSEQVSATEGYRKATAGMGSVGSFVGGAMGLFYKKDGGSWIFFKATQSILMCDDYNTDELRAAYKGETCMVNNQADNYTESFVQ